MHYSGRDDDLFLHAVLGRICTSTWLRSFVEDLCRTPSALGFGLQATQADPLPLCLAQDTLRPSKAQSATQDCTLHQKCKSIQTRTHEQSRNQMHRPAPSQQPWYSQKAGELPCRKVVLRKVLHTALVPCSQYLDVVGGQLPCRYRRFGTVRDCCECETAVNWCK